MSKTFLFQAIRFSQTVLIQTIQLSISTQFSFLQPIVSALSGILARSGPGSDGNERVACIPESPNITWTSPSDCLVSYLGHSLERSYPFSEVQSVYSTARADRAIHRVNVKTVLFHIIQFRLSTQFIFQNSSILNNSV